MYFEEEGPVFLFYVGPITAGAGQNRDKGDKVPFCTPPGKILLKVNLHHVKMTLLVLERG